MATILFRCCVAALMVFFMPVCAAHATVYIDCDFSSAPSSESQGGVYTCSTGSLTLFFGSNGSGPIFDHITSGGWGDSAAAKFYSHTSGDDTYRQLIPSAFSATTQQNIRFLIKFADITELGGKWMDTSNEIAWRTWLSFVPRVCDMGEYSPEIAFNGTTWIAHTGNGQGVEDCLISEGYRGCLYPSTYTAQLSSCTEVETTRMDMADYENTWVCIEIERYSTGIYKVYTWTQDGAYNGLYYWLDTTFNESLNNPNIGPYLEGSMTGQAFIIDEVVVADTYIGPPTGFLGTTVFGSGSGSMSIGGGSGSATFR